MRKSVSVLLLMAMLFTLAACGRAPAVTDATIAEPAKEELSVLPVEEQKRVIEASRERWAFTDPYESPWFYTFTDLDHNGCLEVIAATTQGTGVFTYVNFWEVRPDGSGIENRWPDHVISFVIVIFISVPSFVFAALMQYLFTFIWPIFPTLYNTQAPNVWAAFHSMVLPILALSLNPIATIARYLRGELIETLSSEFMLLARTKGLSQRQATWRHAFRNSMVPIANTIIPMITGIMGGSLVIEKLFAVPGEGGLLVDSIMGGDHFLTVALLIFYSTMSLITILIVDISYGIIDPRIRIGGSK